MSFFTRQPLRDISRVSSEKGDREEHPVTHKPSSHKGIDLVPGDTKDDLDVFAAHDGIVIESGYQMSESGLGYGNYVIVEAPDGRKTRYAHLAQRLVSTGDAIGEGDGKVIKIGIAGNTGGSTGVHLHFEVIAANGIIENPRPYLAEAFPNTFSTTVVAAPSLTGELSGDSRSNTLIANSRPNTLSGGAGNDIYYLPSLSDSDTIIDSDNSGIIKIAGVTLEGNALPKTDLQGNPIAGQWVLNGYDFVKSGENLVIIPAGADISSVDTPRLTINNFPFSQAKAFGISLGKVGFNEYSPEQSVVVNSLRGGGIFPTLDVRGRFTAIITSDGSSKVATFNAEGVIVGELQEIISGEYGRVEVSAPFDFLEKDGSRQILLPFRATNLSQKTATVGLARLDGNSGKIVSRRIFAHETYPIRVNYERSGLSEWANRFFFDYVITDDSISSPPQDHYLHQIDPMTLQDNAPLNSYSGDRGFMNGFLADYPAITLQSGEKIELRGYKTLLIRTPQIRDMTPAEIIPNFSVAPGQEAITSGNYNRAIVTLQRAVDNSVGAALRITPAPNSRLVINGLVARADDAAIDLVDFPTISPDYLHANTHLVSSDRYSLQDLLDGKFTPPTTQDSRGVIARFFDWMSGKVEDEKPSALTPKSLAREAVAGEEDDYYEDPAQISNSTNFNADNPELFSVVVLPNNQQLIITGSVAQNLTRNLGDYFIGVEGIEDTRSNITNPTSENYTLPSNSTSQLPANSTITPVPLPPLQNNSTVNSTVPQLPTAPTNGTNNDGNSGENSSLNIAAIAAPVTAVAVIAVAALATGRAVYNRMQKRKIVPADGTITVPQLRQAWSAESTLQKQGSPATSPLSVSGTRLSVVDIRTRQNS